jgi:hypothetical protein
VMYCINESVVMRTCMKVVLYVDDA